MNSKDRAEAAGGCDEDGIVLLAAMGLDGPPPAQASPLLLSAGRPLLRLNATQVRLLFYSGNWQALIFLGSRTHGNLGQAALTGRRR